MALKNVWKRKERHLKEIKIKYHADIDEICYIGGEKSNWIDLRAGESVEMKAGEYKLISLGVSMELPPNCEDMRCIMQ